MLNIILREDNLEEPEESDPHAVDGFDGLEELARKLNVDRLPHGFVSQFTEESAVFSLIKVNIPMTPGRDDQESTEIKEEGRTMIVESWDKGDVIEDGVENEAKSRKTLPPEEKRRRRRERERARMAEEKRRPPELAACLVIEVRTCTVYNITCKLSFVALINVSFDAK